MSAESLGRPELLRHLSVLSVMATVQRRSFSLDDLENMDLVDLFHEPFPGWAVPKEFRQIVNLAVFNGIHGLAAFSGWAPECLVNSLHESRAEWSVMSCAKDLCSFVTKLREWCLWSDSFSGNKEDGEVSHSLEDVSRSLVLRDLDSPKQSGKSRDRSRCRHSSDDKGRKVSQDKRTPSPQHKSGPRSDKSSKSSKRSKSPKSVLPLQETMSSVVTQRVIDLLHSACRGAAESCPPFVLQRLAGVWPSGSL